MPAPSPLLGIAFALGFTLLAVAATSAQAQSAPAASPAPVASSAAPANAARPDTGMVDPAAALEAKRRDTIRYGIDAEISELIKNLTDEKDSRYDDDLLNLFNASRSPKLRSSVLDFFASLEWNGAEKAALGILDDRDNEDSDLVYSAISYLAAIRSKEALTLSEALIKEDNKKLLPALVRLMGRAGGEPEATILLGWFDGDSATPALKEEAIKALGDIGSTAAAGRLAKFILDGTAGKAARMFACDALAKIKSDTSVDSLVKASNDQDPNLRTSAIQALGAFAGGDGAPSQAAKLAIAEALRDSFPKARIAACQAAASAKVAEALPFLRYKGQSDPEQSVRNEACRSLAILGAAGIGIGTGPDDPFAFLRARLEDKKENEGLRAFCFGLLSRSDPAGSMPVLEARLRAEASEKDRGFYTSLAREVANADKAPGIGALARDLLADKEYLIRIAGIEWARKNKAPDLRADLERLAKDDPSDMIKKRAADALKQY